MKEKIGKGTYGEIYPACCSDKCDYVAKHILVKSTKSFSDEVEIQTLASKYHLAPEIHDSLTCPHGGVIIMDSMKIPLITLIQKFIREKKPQFIYLVMKQVMECYLKLTRLGICHADTHLENIMADYSNDLELYKGNFIVKFIDFGQSFLDKELSRQRTIDWKKVQSKCMDGYSIYKNFSHDVEPLVRDKIEVFFFEYTRSLIYNTIKVSYLDKPIITSPELKHMLQLQNTPIVEESYMFSKDAEVELLSKLFNSEIEEDDKNDLFGNEEEELEILRKSHARK